METWLAHGFDAQPVNDMIRFDSLSLSDTECIIMCQ